MPAAVLGAPEHHFLESPQPMNAIISTSWPSVEWTLKRKGHMALSKLCTEKKEERMTPFGKYRTAITLITDLKGACELFQFYLAASCCDSESKQERRA